MALPTEALGRLWALLEGEQAALEAVTLTGSEPALPSSFRVGTAAQASIAAAALAAAECWRMRTKQRQKLRVDMRHAAIEFRSERYLRVNGAGPANFADDLAGIYRTGDGGFVRLHTNFPHHQRAVLKLLACAPSRQQVARALRAVAAESFEAAANREGGVVAALYDHRSNRDGDPEVPHRCVPAGSSLWLARPMADPRPGQSPGSDPARRDDQDRRGGAAAAPPGGKAAR